MIERLFKNALLIQIFTVIVGVIGMVVDGAITGTCLGTDAMAAYGLVTPIATIFAACACVCGIGASVLVGRIIGARKIEEASQALSSCLLFALLLSALLIAGVFPFSHQIAGLMGARGEINEMASDYLKGFCLCAPAMLMFIIFIPILQIVGNGKIVVFAFLSMTGINVAGDLLNGYVIKAGLWGMAIATTLSYFAAILVILIYLIINRNLITFTAKGLSFKYVREMLKGGLPDALQQTCRSLLIIVMNSILLKIADSDSVAVYTAIMSAANLSLALGSGVGVSTSMLTGVFAGEEDDVAIRKLLSIALKKSLLYNIIFCAVLIAASGIVMPLFLSESELIPMAVLGFRLFCISMIGYSVNAPLRSYYQAMRFSKISYIYVFCNSFLFTALSAFVLSGFLCTNGVWLAAAFGELLSFVFITIIALIGSKNKKGFLEKYLFIPDNFSKGLINRYDGNASSPVEIKEVSEAVYNFCLENGGDKRTSYLISLAVEEISTRSIKSAKLLEVRLLCKEDSWTLRIRDNGKKYNPLDLFKDEKESDFSYIGIKILNTLISDMEYINTLNMNNINIKIDKRNS